MRINLPIHTLTANSLMALEQYVYMDIESRFTIRPLEAGDQDFLWQALYNAIYVAPGQPPLPYSIVEEPDLACYVENWGQAGDYGLLAVDKTSLTPVGATWLRLWPGEQKGYGFVDEMTPELSVSVLPDYQNVGLGTYLMRRLLKDAGQLHDGVSLSVMQASAAVHLYRRLGFKTVAAHDESLIMLLEF